MNISDDLLSFAASILNTNIVIVIDFRNCFKNLLL
jgi:hypothetical protein